jgi:hypothetical protein
MTLTTTAQSEDFDWNSIMLYSSDSAAKVVNGQKLPPLLNFDGSRINPNLRPSEEDTKAVRQL